MNKDLITDVVYEIGTNRVVMVKYNDLWVLPTQWGLMHFENGVEPLMREDPDGNAYVHPSGCLINDIGSWLE